MNRVRQQLKCLASEELFELRRLPSLFFPALVLNRITNWYAVDKIGPNTFSAAYSYVFMEMPKYRKTKVGATCRFLRGSTILFSPGQMR